jgi:molybdopterin-guanine dinucleotide biosynthesis protein
VKTTANQIRAALKEVGYGNRDVSVRSTSGYVIYVKSRHKGVDQKQVKAATLRAYHAGPHNWLVVKCDNTWLPMPRKVVA